MGGLRVSYELATLRVLLEPISREIKVLLSSRWLYHGLGWGRRLPGCIGLYTEWVLLRV